MRSSWSGMYTLDGGCRFDRMVFDVRLRVCLPSCQAMGDVTKAGRRGFARMRDDEVEEEGNEGEIKNEADGRGWFCTFVERERERERES
jgi:hypothetical protein